MHALLELKSGLALSLRTCLLRCLLMPLMPQNAGDVPPNPPAQAAIEKELALKTTQTPDVVAMKLRLAEMLEEDRKACLPWTLCLV